MELFRITAMFLVVLFHISGEIEQLEKPSCADELSLLYSINLLVTSVTFVCVDMFVLLSGWFGINSNLKRIKSLIFQVLFYSVSLYLLMLMLNNDITCSWHFLLSATGRTLFFYNYWFIPAYLMLCILAPILNAYIKQCSERQYLATVIAILIMQSIYGWLGPEAGYKEGTSPVSFIILYLLGGYLRQYAMRIKRLSKTTLMACYVTFTIVSWLIAMTGLITGNQLIEHISWQFSSPLTIAAASCLLLYFSKLQMGYNKQINWIAASSFAVFLIHCFPLFYYHVFKNAVVAIYQSLPLPVSLLALLLFAVLLFMASVLIDQIRIYLSKKIIGSPR